MNNFFKGRINRMKFFLLTLILTGIFVLGFFLMAITFNFQGGGFFIGIWMLIFFISQIALSIRRFHDLGMSGYYSLFYFVPAAGFIFYLILLFQKGVVEENKYGAPIYNSSLYDTLLNK